jgi:hypothetical protein
MPFPQSNHGCLFIKKKPSSSAARYGQECIKETINFREIHPRLMQCTSATPISTAMRILPKKK